LIFLRKQYDAKVTVIIELLNRVINKLEGDPYCLLRNLTLWIRGYKIKLKYSAGTYYVIDGSNKIYLATKVRYGRYAIGINNLVNKLAKAYLLDQIEFKKGDIFVDCGANIGELGIWLQNNYPHVEYIAFEPSPKEFAALNKNLNGSKLVQKALWKSSELLTFNLAEETADSSVIRNSMHKSQIKVEGVRLDKELSDIDKIKLLKIEAEGAEPEVIEGSLNILPRIDYIAVDSGYERGYEFASTTKEVEKLLFEAGYLLIGESSREVRLYKKTY
jgi:FkbM family methyltransferase